MNQNHYLDPAHDDGPPSEEFVPDDDPRELFEPLRSPAWPVLVVLCALAALALWAAAYKTH